MVDGMRFRAVEGEVKNVAGFLRRYISGLSMKLEMGFVRLKEIKGKL